MASQDTSKKRLALAIIDFLNSSATDGTVDAEDAESIEIASNCISEAFKVDATDKTAMSDALGGQTLLSIYSVYEKLKGKSTASTEGKSSASEARPATPATPALGSKEEAEKLKGQGNAAMQQKDYQTAIDFYTKALEIVPLNPIYLSNRAAAYSGAGQLTDAKQDAEMAVAADPKYTKAWSRLGHANFLLRDYKGSMEAYKAGIDAEGSGGSEAMKRGYETAKKKYEEEAGDVGAPDAPRGMPAGSAGGMPDLSSLACMFGGGAGGGGGMPDMGELFRNPQLMQMAQQFMSNPDAMRELMNNPNIRQMAESFGGRGGGGGAGGQGGGPDIASLLSNPAIAEMAQNFMGGGRGAPGRGAGGPGQ